MDDIELMKLKQEFRKMCDNCYYKKSCEKSQSLNNWMGTFLALAVLAVAIAVYLFK